MIIQKRLSKTKFFGKIISFLPFVRCVILNGSLATGKSTESSDIDILIIAKTGRIFTARFFVNSFTSILHLKRSPNETRNHAGKFCFNHFLTENFLKITAGRGEEMDRYCAENFSQCVFVAGSMKKYDEFLLANHELFEKYDCKNPNTKNQISNKFQIPTPKLQKFLEKIFGDWFEQFVKNYQIKKIEKDPRTKKYPTLIVYNNREMRFHPPKDS